MQLYHYSIPGGNFGDDMNLWFWDELMPDWRQRASQATMFGIGTILTGSALSQYAQPMVFGSGTGYGLIRSELSTHARFFWVRGPHTARMLGIEPERFAIADSAVMTPLLASFKQLGRPSRRPVFIPHHTTAKLDLDWTAIGEAVGVDVVLPEGDAREVIARLRDAPLVLAESMHAAILADAFRVPWISIRISHVFNEFKWRDWADSMEVSLEIKDSLVPLRRGYDLLSRLRRAVPFPAPSRKMAKNPVTTSSSAKQPVKENSREKERLKSIIHFAAPVFQRILIADLRKAMRSAPQLSRDDVLAERQERILSRIEDWRRETV